MLIKTFKKDDSLLMPKNATEAVDMQNSLRHKVSIKNDFKALNIIAGIDCSYDIKNNISIAVAVLMNLDDLLPFESVMALQPTSFPYIPGLLSFREIPVIMAAISCLKNKPDLFMVDGHGIAHPRRLGIAAHLGVLTDTPAIGVAKSRLTGTFIEPGRSKDDMTELLGKDEKIGTVLRSKKNIKPIFISPGHRIDHETSLEIVLKCLRGYRLPEPTRIADKLSKDKPKLT